MSKELKEFKNDGVVKLRKIMDNQAVSQQFERAWKENASSFMASVIEVVSSDKKLQMCNPQEVIKECLKAAVLKLPIGNILGYAHIVAFKDKKDKRDIPKPSLILGYRGLTQLAIRTGQYRYINRDMVYEGETVNKDRINGKITITGQPKNIKAKGYFAHIELLNGFKKTIYMTKEEVKEHAQKYSAAYRADSLIWKNEFDKMGLKTVLRQLLDKYGIKSIDMLNIEVEERELEEINKVKPEQVANVPEIPKDLKPKDDCAGPGF